MHYFGMSYDDIYYNMPYRLLVMLTASVPTYERETEKDPKTGKGMHLGEILGGMIGNEKKSNE